MTAQTQHHKTPHSHLIFAGTISKAHGLKGGFFIRPSDILPVDFIPDKKATLLIKPFSLDENPSLNCETLITNCYEAGDRPVWVCEAWNSRTEVDKHLGDKLFVSVSEKNASYTWLKYIGFSVFSDAGKLIGIVKKIGHFGAQKNLIIQSESDYFVYPLLAQYIKSEDKENRVLTVEHIDIFLTSQSNSSHENI